ncbi:MAG: glutathione S-transferase family protein [Pseudomonadales bacterium]|nr:glutathione S-transferase family protein [Pseudomonadales bacterium]
MIEVLGRRNSANVQKVMWALGELGVDYTRRDIGGSFGYPNDYPNPNSVVPTIRDGDVTVWESAACVRYLARTYGFGSMWPEDPATLATSDMWMEWHRSDISAAFFPLFQAKVRGLPIPLEKQDQMVIDCGRLFGQLDAQLSGGTFICGDQITGADIVNGAIMYRYMSLSIERPDLPNLQQWYERLTARPAYQKHVMVEFGTNIEEWDAHERANTGIQ